MFLVFFVYGFVYSIRLFHDISRRFGDKEVNYAMMLSLIITITVLTTNEVALIFIFWCITKKIEKKNTHNSTQKEKESKKRKRERDK